jgi:Cys-tRNA(Pro) deacylase
MSKAPSTNATRLLKQAGIAYTEHLYRYEGPVSASEASGRAGLDVLPNRREKGTAVSARELGLDEHAVIKTLVMEDEKGAPLIILMHGDREVSTRELARQIGAKSVAPCKPEVANRHSGYLVGGTSPFGTRKAMPVYVEGSVLELERIWINGGSRGFLVGMEPAAVSSLLKAVPVSVGIRS